jgi:hypothetical protein
MASIIYTHLSGDQGPEAARAPYAVHHAVTRLRQSHPTEPLMWAPYIHLGP